MDAILYSKILKAQDDIKEIQDSFPLKPVYTPITITPVVGYYIAANGSITQIGGETYFGSDFVDISAFDDLYISASGNWGNALWAFYDESKSVVSVGDISASSAAYTEVNDKYVLVPQNAKYVYVGARNTYAGPTIKAKNAFAPQEKWYGKKWVCVGDSLTERNSRTTKNYADYVSEKTDISIVNMGLSGTGYKRTDGTGTAFYQRILNIPTTGIDVVTIFGSGNDLNYTAMGFNSFAEALGDPTDTGTTTICGCINTTIDNLYSILPTVQLGIITPCPWESYPPYSTGNNMELYSDAIVAICKRRGIPCLDLYHCSAMRPWETEFKELCYSKDGGNGTHPDETGHKILAPHFEAFLEQLII